MANKSKQYPETNEDVPLQRRDERVARIVLSVAGRDKNRYFVICGVIDEKFVLIADGKLRHIENPKKKKTMHLRFMGYAGDEMREKIYSGRATDNMLRKVIEQYVAASDGDETYTT